MTRALAALLAALLALPAMVGCDTGVPKGPVDARGSPLAQGDPDRYLPPRLDGLRARRLAPAVEQANFDPAAVYGVKGWCRDYRGAIVGTTEDPEEPPAGFLAVCRTTGRDARRARRLTYFAAGRGRFGDVHETRVAGEEMTTGRLTNNTGRYDFVAWQPTDDVVAVLTVTVNNRRGLDLRAAAADLVRWAHR